MSETSSGQTRARKLRQAVQRIAERVREVRSAMQDDARRTHRGVDSEQSGGVRGRLAMQQLVRGARAPSR